MKSEHAMIRRVLCAGTLACEELEAVIAPQIRLNHNETFLDVPEELEAVIAPGHHLNHNETFLAVPEELEAVIAPSTRLGNHNETFLTMPE